ncbi:ovochymase-1 isoform X3 [Dendrobates tinctorius]|uniref:ovochymase-1 isoform X3 n=1 Tax=Dendrobates tinctorius TaxID=92724 RepID=UPI003CC95ED9
MTHFPDWTLLHPWVPLLGLDFSTCLQSPWTERLIILEAPLVPGGLLAVESMALCVWLLLVLRLSSGITDVSPSSPVIAKRWSGSPRTAGMKCGIPPLRKMVNLIQASSRIVGGADAPIGGQPWTVSIKFYERHICGGAIVERNLVVTAAHCVYPADNNKVQHLLVVAGEYDQSNVDPEQQEIPVSEVKLHPEYKHDGSRSYDIALVYLRRPVILGSRVQPVCLPQVGEKTEPGTLCVTSGWGRVSENVFALDVFSGGEPANILQEVSLPILDDETCRSALVTMGLPALHESMLCAGFPDGSRDACQGDSGGPLVCRRRSGTWVLVGSTSWGAGCGRAWGAFITNGAALGSPAVYSRTSALMDFIRNSSSDSICSSRPLTIVAKNGYIKYPLDANSNYSNNSQCRWTIISSANIKIRFIKLDLEDHVTCAHDSLTFTVKQKEVRKLCGSVLPSPLIIRSGNVTVSFISDGSVSGRGFEFEFSTLCPTSKKGSGCGSAAELREEGKIFTLNYPGLYPSNTSCRWVIEAPEGSMIQIVFEDFSLEYQKRCEYDHVSIYSDREESRLIVTLCGFLVDRDVFSPSNIMVVKFQSDHEGNYAGFKARFSFVYPDRLHFADGQTDEKSIQTPPALNQESEGLHIGEKLTPLLLGPGVCGVAPLPPQWLLSRIVGGEESCPNCWPWQVAMMYEDTFLCGGVIVSPQWALTAAHCKVSSDVSQYRLIAGIHDRSMNESSRQVRMVHFFAAHEAYNPITRDYDLALIRLAKELTFNDFVRPVCLPSMEEPLEPSSLCVVTGWGSTREDGQYSNRLQQLPVPILNNNICNSTYYPGAISDNMFCAGFPGGEGKDACQGDSGGPLVCPRSNKTYVLYGIVSWGVGCARRKRPGVYTRVRSFLSWIENTQKEVNKTLHHPHNPIKKPMSPEGQRSLPTACPNDLLLEDTVGSIASPGFPYGYTGGLICSWIISTSSSRGLIKIVVEQVSIGEYVNCMTESLSIYQEKNNVSQLIVREFMETSWKKSRTRENCKDVIETSENGVITSPGYPTNEYPSDLRCEWRIIAPLGSIIRLDIDSLITEEDETGCRDVLRVYQGLGEQKFLRGYFCGNMSDYSMKTSSPEMTLVFTSDSKVSMNGFISRYSFWKLQTDSINHSEDLSNLSCPVLKVLRAGTSKLKSPGYPVTYLSGLDCRWIISSESGHELALYIVDLGLEDSPNCTWDFLSIYDGDGNDTTLLVSLCGNKSNRVFISRSGFLILHFHTDNSVSSRGFHIRYGERNRSSVMETWRSVEVAVDYDLCGVSSVDPMPKTKSASMTEVVTDEKGTPRVVGGQNALPRSWPWIANLEDQWGDSFCGATIIHEKWLLTAAHCNFVVGSDRVILGHVDRSSANRTEAVVRKSYIHELYDNDLVPPDYDLCLLELEFPLLLGDSVTVICLPQEAEKFGPDSCLTAGWGATKGRSIFYPKLLRQANIKVMSTEDCKSYWGPDVTERNLCAGASGASACLGDSGGPLICRSENKYKLVGVVSWGSDTCDPNAPAVYSSVSKYRAWIEKHIR